MNYAAYSNLLGIGGCPESDPKYIDTITATTLPDYDQWGPDCYWEGKHWVRWYNKLKEAHGKAQADTQFAAAWQKRSAFGHELWIANNDVEFRNMVVAEGLNQTVPDLAIIKATGSVAETVGNVAGSAADVVGNLAGATANTAEAVGTITKWLPWILLAGMVVVAYVMISNKTIKPI